MSEADGRPGNLEVGKAAFILQPIEQRFTDAEEQCDLLNGQ
jgi:hypothetical protein